MTKEKMIDVMYDTIWPSQIWFQAYTDEYNSVIMIWDVLDYLKNILWDSNSIICDKMNELEIHRRSDWWEYEEIRDIPTVVDWIEEDVFEIKLVSIRDDLRKPIEHQSEECILFIYELIWQQEKNSKEG